jgi:hypothetical protein
LFYYRRIPTFAICNSRKKSCRNACTALAPGTSRRVGRTFATRVPLPQTIPSPPPPLDNIKKPKLYHITFVRRAIKGIVDLWGVELGWSERRGAQGICPIANSVFLQHVGTHLGRVYVDRRATRLVPFFPSILVDCSGISVTFLTFGTRLK